MSEQRMYPEELVALIRDCQSRFPCESWEIGNVQIWPLIRTRLFSAVSPKPASLNSPRTPPPIAELQNLWKGAKTATVATAMDWHKTAVPIKKSDVLLLSDGVSYVQLGSQWYDRFFHPIAEELDKLSLTSLLWAKGRRCFYPRALKSAFIQPWVDGVSILGRVPRPLFKLPYRLADFDAASQWIRTHSPLAFPSAEHLGKLVYGLKVQQTFYQYLLRRTHAKAAFLTCYYGLDSMAFTLACHALRIPSIDVQHGYAGDAHFAYAALGRIPPGGYKLLPSFFWSWSAAEVQSISEGKQDPEARHQTFVGGNLLLSRWHRSDNPFIKLYRAKIAALCTDLPATPHVLFTIGAETQEELEALACHIENSPFVWWVRAHPTQLHRLKDIQQAFSTITHHRVFIEQATHWPLYALLEHVDAHVTEGSTVVIEASAFNVPSVMVSSLCAMYYRDLIARGWIRVLQEGESLTDAIREQIMNHEQLARSQSIHLACPLSMEQIMARVSAT